MDGLASSAISFTVDFIDYRLSSSSYMYRISGLESWVHTWIYCRDGLS